MHVYTAASRPARVTGHWPRVWRRRLLLLIASSHRVGSPSFIVRLFPSRTPGSHSLSLSL